MLIDPGVRVEETGGCRSRARFRLISTYVLYYKSEPEPYGTLLEGILWHSPQTTLPDLCPVVVVLHAPSDHLHEPQRDQQFETYILIDAILYLKE